MVLRPELNGDKAVGCVVVVLIVPAIIVSRLLDHKYNLLPARAGRGKTPYAFWLAVRPAHPYGLSVN